MPIRDTDKATDDKPDGGEATTSTSATDASTTQGRAAALGGTPAADPQRVVIEQAPPEPAVFYGEGGVQAPTSEPVKADYQPFEW